MGIDTILKVAGPKVIGAKFYISVLAAATFSMLKECEEIKNKPGFVQDFDKQIQ